MRYLLAAWYFGLAMLMAYSSLVRIHHHQQFMAIIDICASALGAFLCSEALFK